MAKFTPTGKVLPHELLDRFTPTMASRDSGRPGGRVGGRMVRVMIKHAEEALARGGR